LDATAARVLGSASRLTHLKTLNLAINNIGSEGVAALLGGGVAWLSTVENLDLSGNFGRSNVPLELEEKEAAQALIAAAPNLPSLTSLSFNFLSNNSSMKMEI
jgi:Ran GTPase-activating protein (RanGAP) involved in mRNA processing and transport